MSFELLEKLVAAGAAAAVAVVAAVDAVVALLSRPRLLAALAAPRKMSIY